jgi:hypothetical protein
VRSATAVVDGQAKQFNVEYMGRWDEAVCGIRICLCGLPAIVLL